MSSKFVEAPGLINGIEAKLAEHGVVVDVPELAAMAVIGVVVMGVCRNLLSAA